MKAIHFHVSKKLNSRNPRPQQSLLQWAWTYGLHHKSLNTAHKRGQGAVLQILPDLVAQE